MKIAAISDVHVKSPNDSADRLLSLFLSHPQVTSADYVLLLGDVFDLMCGPHNQYLVMFSHIFDQLDWLQRNGIKVFYFEGNHDVHLEQLFNKRWPNNEILLYQKPRVEMIDNHSYYFSHGDEHEVDNVKYQKYKSFITSTPLKFVANHVMPYRLLNYLGERASRSSRKRGAREYNEGMVKERFRSGVKATTGGKYNFILGGHSHVKDLFHLSDTSVYINNGFAMQSKTFILIHDHKVSFQPLA
jgi:UDP-2,3-diacylglucosamine hydrolase